MAEMGASSYASLAAALALLGFDFEINEPNELREEVTRLTERYARSLNPSEMHEAK